MAFSKKTSIYWFSQITGWGLFVLGNIISASIQDMPFASIRLGEFNLPSLYVWSFFIFSIGILTTHLFRNLVHHWGWKKINIPPLIPRMLVAAFAMSATFTTFNTLITDALTGQIPLIHSIHNVLFLQNIFNFSALFLLWEIIYFSANTFENWKREEILNLELRASKTEMELNSLKAQMNPHFVFNCMNGIRALVDEDPEKAKNAITMLSVILRNNLTLGRYRTIPLSEELDLVEKYLSLEKIRFEERLTVKFDVSVDSLTAEIPPFVMQTIVENAIKHGISKKVEGGEILVKTNMEGDMLRVTIVNTGNYSPPAEGNGIGLINTSKRLQIIYGEQAKILITDRFQEVWVEILIPKKSIQNENTHH